MAEYNIDETNLELEQKRQKMENIKNAWQNENMQVHV